MKPSSDKKTNPLNGALSLVIKIVLAALALGYIIYDVRNRLQLNDSIALYKTIFQDSRLLWLFPLSALLLVFNWSIEVWKWRWMMKKITQLTFFRAFSAVFMGLTVSFFTPNRVGEYAGRVLFLKRGERIKGILITILSSFSQLLITITVGLVCLIFYMKSILVGHNPILYYITISIILLLIVLMLLLYFNVHIVAWLCSKWNVNRRVTRYLRVFQYYSFVELLKLYGMSALRYFVFSFQFFLMLQLFHVDLPFFKALEMMALTYLTIAIVPTFALTEIGVRGSAALYFFGTVSSNALGILTASLTIWIMNIALPSAIGAFCVLYVKNKKG